MQRFINLPYMKTTNTLLHAVVIIILSGVFLQSCRSLASFDDMNKIRKGMSPDEISTMLDLKPAHTITVQNNNREYVVDMYKMKMSQVSSSSYSPGVGGRQGITTTTTTVGSGTFLFMFSSGKLMYWGFMNEFSKDDDTEIAALAPKVYNEYYKIYEK